MTEQKKTRVLVVDDHAVVRSGIRSRLQSVCSITLGTQAVNPLEMTDAYATLASRGIHHPPQALAVVRGPQGQILGGLDAHGARAIPQSTADLVTCRSNPGSRNNR